MRLISRIELQNMSPHLGRQNPQAYYKARSLILGYCFGLLDRVSDPLDTALRKGLLKCGL